MRVLPYGDDADPRRRAQIFYHVTKEGAQGVPALLRKWGPFISKRLGRSFEPIEAADVAKHEYAGQQEFGQFRDCVFTVYVTKPAAAK